MQHLEEISERIRLAFEVRTVARDRALAQARTLTRHCANAIRAIHRDESSLALENLEEARLLAEALRADLAPYPELYYAGYTQDALKEYAEASTVYALITGAPLPTPEALGLHHATYLQGLAEAAGELRRRCLDILRHGHSDEAERLRSAYPNQRGGQQDGKHTKQRADHAQGHPRLAAPNHQQD